MPSSSKWVSTILLPLSAVSLGRLVGDVCDPQAEYEDTSQSTERPNGPKLISTEIKGENYEYDASAARSSELSLAITTLLESTLSLEKNTVVKINAELITTRKISNSSAYFKKACQVDEARELLERRWRDMRKVFMATGVITLTNAQITFGQGKKVSGGPSIKLPGSLVILAATQGAVPTLGGLEDVLDSELGITRRSENYAESTLSFPGENIFAVQYQRVDFSWFRKPSKKIPSLKEGAQWRAYLGNRGDESDDEPFEKGPSDEEDIDMEEDEDFGILKAQLGSELEPDDLGDCAKYEDFGLEDGEKIWHIT